ncbi:hypothetical protein EAI_15526, partial [Harpegnathos saltator]
LTASVLDAAKQVLGIAARSENIKGTYVKVLRDAATAIAAGATILTKRVAKVGGDNLDILEVRSENQKLHTSHVEVKREVEELKE